MGLATFRGGVHPFEGKELSMDRAVTVLKPTSGEMVYPLSQHIGAPAKAIVKVGDEVLVGQKIAEAGGFISAVVVSSVSGKVKKIGNPGHCTRSGHCGSRRRRLSDQRKAHAEG